MVSVVAGYFDGIICITRINNGKLVRKWKVHNNWVTCVCVTPNGKYVMSGSSYGGIICITRISDGKLVYKLKNHAREVTSVYVTPDGKYNLIIDCP